MIFQRIFKLKTSWTPFFLYVIIWKRGYLLQSWNTIFTYWFSWSWLMVREPQTSVMILSATEHHVFMILWEFTVDHWTWLGFFCFFCFIDTWVASHFKPNHDHGLLRKSWMGFWYEKEEETSATYLNWAGKKHRTVCGKTMEKVKGISAKTSSNEENTVLQIWQCHLHPFILKSRVNVDLWKDSGMDISFWCAFCKACYTGNSYIVKLQ